MVEHLYAPREYAKCVSQLLCPKGYALSSAPYHGYWKNVAMAVPGKMTRTLQRFGTMAISKLVRKDDHHFAVGGRIADSQHRADCTFFITCKEHACYCSEAKVVRLLRLQLFPFVLSLSGLQTVAEGLALQV